MVRLFRAKTNQALSVNWLFSGSEGNPFRVIGRLDEDTIMAADVLGRPRGSGRCADGVICASPVIATALAIDREGSRNESRAHSLLALSGGERTAAFSPQADGVGVARER